MSKLNVLNNNKIESGFENFDDCAIYKINDQQSIIQTVDFFTPIVDDPYTFGTIAAANSLSDIYAMGGNPLFALNIVAFPTEKLSLDVLSLILKGGQDKCNEANINILGGHSITDDVPKFGLAVTGIINNDKILRNNSPKEGDVILLTKPLGTGIITTAIKKGLADNTVTQDAIKLMSELNVDLSNMNNKIKINACTDVTGYGLLGHLSEMCSNTNLTASINFNNISFINKVNDFALKNIVPGGTKNNLKFYQSNVHFDKGINKHQKLMLADAQTSGGLLISINKNDSNILIDYLNNNSYYKTQIIGNFSVKKNINIIVNNE